MNGWILAVAATAGIYEIILKKLKGAQPTAPPTGVAFGFDTDADAVVDGAKFLRFTKVEPADTLYVAADPDSHFWRCRLNAPIPADVAASSTLIFRQGNHTSNQSTSAPDVLLHEKQTSDIN